MDGETRQGSMRLARGAFARISGARDALVRVHQGELWITQEGDTRDYVVGAGQSFRVERRGVVLACALRGSTVSLVAPAAARYRWAESLARAWFGAYISLSRPTSAGF